MKDSEKKTKDCEPTFEISVNALMFCNSGFSGNTKLMKSVLFSWPPEKIFSSEREMGFFTNLYFIFSVKYIYIFIFKTVNIYLLDRKVNRLLILQNL